jgi:hypothetical protein
MTDKVMALFALAVLAGYLGILVFNVPRLDLGIVVGATLLLVIWDFLFHDRRSRKPGDIDS